MILTGKKIIILVETLYNDREFWYPYNWFKEKGAEVSVVGPVAGGEYKSKDGIPARAEKGMDEMGTAGFDAIIIPGGTPLIICAGIRPWSGW